MEKLIEPAKKFLLSYFSDGERKQPSDLDEDIIGGIDVSMFGPRWNNTPFFHALAELVEEKTILFEELEDGYYYYWLNPEFKKDKFELFLKELEEKWGSGISDLYRKMKIDFDNRNNNSTKDFSDIDPEKD